MALIVQEPDVAAQVTGLRESLGLDAILITSPTNSHFVSGCRILTQELLPDRLALVIHARAGEVFVVCDIEAPQARAESRIADVRGYTEFATSPIAAAALVIQELDAGYGALGFERRHLTAHHYDELRRLLPNAELVAVDEPLARLRTVKSPSEIDLLRSAFLATDRAIASAYETSRPEDTTRTIAARMKTALLGSGADQVAFSVIGGGAQTLQGHPEATDEPLRQGDALRVDFGGRFHGYHTDLARSAFFRSATKQQRETYRRLWQSLEELLSAVRPGVRAQQLYRVGREAMTRNGLRLSESNGVWELPHVGHGIGLAIHEFPILEPSESQVLEPGMVLCLELIYTEPEVYRLHVEDSVVVSETGGEILSRSRDWAAVPILAK